MATLVLTVVGSAIGGPIGGAIGAAIGQQVDSAIFAPRPREGPRLKELAVQTSSYGSQVPAIFGVMRVAGTVIWATDLVERRARSGGGKGRPMTANYSYSVSMAVALSSRPIARIGRIWADGNLLRGAAGDLKVDTQLRIYNGTEDQPLDPLMASAEQAGQCPAHRGMAYALFEDLQLADYGNRIPSLTFEVFEREGLVPVNAIFEAASGGAVHGRSSQSVSGFAVSGASAREPLGALLDILPLELAARDGRLVLRDPVVVSGNAALVIPVVGENREVFDPPRQTLDPAANLPHAITLRYYDGDRDFQASLQRSERGRVSRNMLQIELPAVLSAAHAKQVVEQRHLRLQVDRKSWQGEIALGPDMLFPGDIFPDDAGRNWRVEQIEQRFGSVRVSARAAVADMSLSAPIGTPGRSLPSPDLVVGETRIAVIEMPVFGADDPGKPVVAVFAAGTGAGWRRASLALKLGESLIDIGTTALPATMGTSIDALSPHNVSLIDEGTGLRVQLLNSAMDISERRGSPLDVDAPYFWLDGELIRFGSCEALGGGIYLLSRLQRGCFQSDLSVPFHPAGAHFVLVEPGSARLIEDRNFVQGDVATIEALGLGDNVPVAASVTVEALAIRPLVPVHGSSAVLNDGSVMFRWVRRSRIDAGWRDGVDQLLAEQAEQYRVLLTADGSPVGEWTVPESSVTFSPATWAALAIPQDAEIIAKIFEVGRHAVSPPLAIHHWS